MRVDFEILLTASLPPYAENPSYAHGSSQDIHTLWILHAQASPQDKKVDSVYGVLKTIMVPALLFQLNQAQLAMAPLGRTEAL